MGIFSRARREMGFAFIRDIGRDYGLGALVATHTVSSLYVHFELPAATPEMMLLALRQDDAIRAAWPLAPEVEEEIEVEAVDRHERSPYDDGWSARGTGVINTAWSRAGGRSSKRATRGDLLSGLAGASGLPGRLLREAELDLARFDGDDPPVDLDAVDPPQDPAEDTSVWVVSINDETTPMPVVTRILREAFGCAEPRAVHLMYATHFFGAAPVAELPFAEASRRVERATEIARAAGTPFELRVVAPAE